MRRVTGLMLALMVMAGAAAQLLAHEETFKGTVIETHKDKVHVSVIDEKTKKVSSMEFKVTSKTKVLRGDKVMKFADAKIVKGERIAVTVNHDDSMTDATVIRLAAPAGQ
jgi:maltose-binding protein MalE